MFSLLAALTLCLAQLPLSAFAAEFKTVPDVKFIWGESITAAASLQPNVMYVPASPGGVKVAAAKPKSGAVSGLTFKNCPDVQITETGLENSTFTLDNSVLRLGSGDGAPVFSVDGTWKYGGEADAEDPCFLNDDPCAACYRVGSGALYYEPGDSPRLTLDGAAHTGEIDFQGASVQVALRDRNKAEELRGKTVEKTEMGSGGPRRAFTVYGERSTADFGGSGAVSVQERTPLRIEKEAVPTVPAGEEMVISAPRSLTSKGTLINDGTVILEGAAAQGSPAWTIKKLSLTGRGTVKARIGKQPPSIYFNSGVLRLAPAGEVDLSGASTKTKLTFSGGPLKIEKGVLLTGGDNALTVTEGAEVIVYDGGSGCVSVGGAVTVDGTLTADSGDKGIALGAGKVSMGPKGVLKVSGQTGVLLAA